MDVFNNNLCAVSEPVWMSRPRLFRFVFVCFYTIYTATSALFPNAVAITRDPIYYCSNEKQRSIHASPEFCCGLPKPDFHHTHNVGSAKQKTEVYTVCMALVYCEYPCDNICFCYFFIFSKLVHSSCTFGRYIAGKRFTLLLYRWSIVDENDMAAPVLPTC